MPGANGEDPNYAKVKAFIKNECDVMIVNFAKAFANLWDSVGVKGEGNRPALNI